MSPVVAMWLASIVGAILFFAAGFLSGRSSPEAVGESDESGAKAELSEAKAELTKVTGARDSLEAQVKALKGQLKSVGDGKGDQEKQLAELKSELGADYETRAKKLEDEYEAQLTRLQTENEREVDSLRAEVARLQRELEANQEDDSDGLDEEKTRVAGALGPSASATSSSDFDDQATRVRASSTGALDGLLDGYDHDADSINSLRLALEMQVAEDPTWTAATLADDLGMPIIGAGDHRDSLAIFSSFIMEFQRRSQALLPLNALRRLTVEDTDGVVVSSCTMQELGLSLVTLTQHATPSTPAMKGLLESTTRML